MGPIDRCTKSRSGVLLLVVLSVLTLFLMLGATYITVARQARLASRAYADNVTAATAAGAAERRLVDDAFLAIVRGTNAATAPAALTTGDDLLGDKYGHRPPVTGRITDVTTVSGSQAFLKLTTSGLTGGATSAAELNGRVMTLIMPGVIATTRILQATGTATSPKIIIAAGPTVAGIVLSNSVISDAIDASSGDNMVINGREFSGVPGLDKNEPYDGFDAQNPLLAQIIPAENGIADNNGDGDSTDVEVVNLPPLYGSTPPDVDNDADGIADSAFIDIGLPPVLSRTGQLVYPRAAILVTDLEGRLNLNVHGTAVDADLLLEGTNRYATNIVPQHHLPRGLSVGPASVSIARSQLLGSSPNEQDLTEFGQIAVAGLPKANIQNEPNDSTGRETPKISGAQGRLGGTIPYSGPDFSDVSYSDDTPRPGVKNVNDNGPKNDAFDSQMPDVWRAGLFYDTTAPKTWRADNYFANPGRFGSPFDYKGRLRIWADPATGQPVYYKPFWDDIDSGRGRFDNELVDDPYEANVGTRIPRGDQRSTSTAPDNFFSAGELEGLLRYFDSDSLKLSRRLVTLFGPAASEARLSVTTDSWNTPAIVGAAWRDVIGPFAAEISGATSAPRASYPGPYSRVQDVFALETLMGLKLDINRPFHDAPEDANGNGVLDANEDLDHNGWLDAEPNDQTGLVRRQLLAQQLYCLMIAIAEANGPTPTAKEAEQIAQYAVNIVDFRDADSVMTPFDYDENFGGGSTAWTPTQRVWGCERPELIITETFAWHDRNTTYDVMAGTFSQSDRPEGLFYVEIASPWNAKAYEYDGTNAVAKTLDEAVTGDYVRGRANGITDAGELRGEPLPVEFIDANDRPDLLATRIDLEKVNSNSDPVWRLVSVDGNNAFGTDPGLASTHTGSNWALDPARSGGPTPEPERYFYFTQPVADTADLPCHDITSETAIFWQSSSGGFNPGPGTYGVAGTPRSSPFGSNVANATSFRAFKGVNGQFGTLTEPLGLADGSGKSVSNGSTTLDPYDQLVKASLAAGYGSYTQGMDPLTSSTDANYGSWTNSPNAAIDANNDSRLLINGTHANYAVVYLQRLANPNDAWDATGNPYLTIDCMPVDLTVVNTDGGSGNNLDDPAGGDPEQNQYRPDSVQRGGTTATVDFDIWNRSPLDRDTPLDLNDDATFRTPNVNNPSARAISVAPAVSPPGVGNHGLGVAPDARNSSSSPYPWLVFLNRPFVSAAEVALVPVASPFHLTQRHSPATSSSVSTPDYLHHLAGFFESPTPAAPWNTVTGRSGTSHPSLLDFVHVPSPYVGLRNTVPLSPTANRTALENQLGLDVLPLEQISTFREPGRVNVNTITDSRVWRSLFGSLKAQGDPDAAGLVGCDALPGFSTEVFGRTALDDNGKFLIGSSRAIFEHLPARETATRQASASAGGFRDSFSESHRDTDMHPYFRYQTRMQLENLVTVRSNVYAIWVTIGYFYEPTGGDEVKPIKRNRGFYIFDRSIPVAYERGKDHNVRDAILLRRIIQ